MIERCTCGHGNLSANFHMTPCPIKVAHLEFLRDHDHDWMEFGGPGDEWRECFLCGKQEES